VTDSIFCRCESFLFLGKTKVPRWPRSPAFGIVSRKSAPARSSTSSRFGTAPRSRAFHMPDRDVQLQGCFIGCLLLRVFVQSRTSARFDNLGERSKSDYDVDPCILISELPFVISHGLHNRSSSTHADSRQRYAMRIQISIWLSLRDKHYCMEPGGRGNGEAPALGLRFMLSRTEQIASLRTDAWYNLSYSHLARLQRGPPWLFPFRTTRCTILVSEPMGSSC
jgi:hypothetical protein